VKLSSPFFLPVCCGLGGDVTSFVFLIYVRASEFLAQICHSDLREYGYIHGNFYFGIILTIPV